MAWFECSGGKKAKIYSLGGWSNNSSNSTTYNIKSLLPDVDYTKLTNANFFVEIGTVRISGYSTYMTTYSMGKNDTVSHSYNPSTGILTVSGLYLHNVTYSGNQNCQIFGVLNIANCYVAVGVE